MTVQKHIVADTLHDGHPFTPTQVTVVITSLLLMILDGFDITSMAYVAHRVSDELSIDAANLGGVFSITLAGIMFGALFLAPLADRYGRRALLIYSVGAAGLSMVITGFIDALWHLYLLRFITGLAVGCMLANVTALTSEYTPNSHRSFTVAIIAAGFPLGATAGGFLAPALMASMSWAGVFVVPGVLTLLMAFIVYLLIPESIPFLAKRNRQADQQDIVAILSRMKRPVAADVAIVSTTNNDEAPVNSVRQLVSPHWRARTTMLWGTFFCVFMGMYFFMSWLPKLAIGSGLSEQQGIYTGVALNFGGVVGTILLGWLAVRFGLSRLVGVFLLLAAVLLVILAQISAQWTLIGLLFVLGFFMQGGYVGLYSVSAKMYPAEIRATGIGWALGLGRSGAVIGPYFGGLLIAGGMTMQSSFLVFAGPLLVAATLVSRLKIK
ncbi:MFS transporter [Alteromonas lipolytica]|uniref:4-hydroxybenzoate transporter n=1 Tax=Alteromonas lipolytica TaxID=1856405 RepID=A0A1E8FBY0_9ALTE|nr:MFS transporter [Alteromonas lipolytica]OFI33003.1 4-hydroxybenzoate transporter [Alteromonas lipolytica]GGF63407.1 MFS transporter [Alteromonas lipolytica]